MRRAVMLAVALTAGLACGAAPPLKESPERLKMRQEAAELNAMGVRLFREGRATDALKAVTASLRLRQNLYPPELFPQGHPDLAMTLYGMGFLLEAMGEPARALEYHRQALGMRQKLYPTSRFQDGHPDLAMSLSKTGFVLQQMGEPAKALEYHLQALGMRQKLYPPSRFTEGHPDLAVSLTGMGFVLRAMGEPAKAEGFFQQALVMHQKLYPPSRFTEGHPNLANSLDNLGGVLKAMGEPAKALEYHQQALGMKQKLYAPARFKDGHPDLASSLNNLGIVLEAMGEPAKALEYHQQALEMRQKLYPANRFQEGHPQLAGSLNSMGVVLQRLEAPAKAVEYHQQALAMEQKLYPPSRFPDGHPDLASSLNNLGFGLQAMGESAKARQHLQQAVVMRQKLYPAHRFQDGHQLLAVSLNNLGIVLQAMGEPAKALEYHQQALEMSQKLYPANRFQDGHPDLIGSLHNLGSVLQAMGEPAKALKYLRQGLAMEQRLAVQLAATASEARALNHAHSLPLTRDVYLSVSRSMDGHDAYPLIWQGKAALSRVIEQRHQAALAAATPQARERFDHLVGLRRQRQQLLLAPVVKDTVHRDKRLRELEEEIETGDRQLRRLLPELERLERLTTTRTEQLQKALPGGYVLIDLLRYIDIEFLERGKRQNRTPSYVGFVVRRDRVARVELGEAKPIEEAVQQWRQAISEGADGDRQAQTLRRLVWEPLAKHLPAGTSVVYLSPDMALSRLPWAGLPNGKGGVLLQDYTLCQVPHGVHLLDRLTTKPATRTSKPTLLALGDVAYDEVPAKETVVADLRSPPSKGKLVWNDLPGTRRELDRLGKLATACDVRRLDKGDATVARLLAELPKARYAHLATHGFFADPSFRSILQLDEKLFAQRMSLSGDTLERVGAGAQSPLLLSGLVCAGANRADTPERGIVTADAVAQLDLRHLELAVLSACETGLGETAGGEGVFGLQRAFHIGGTGTVVASLWKVEDDATAALMTLFYRNLWHPEKPLPAVEAMRQAQLAVYLHPEHVKEWSQGRGPKPGVVVAGSAAPKGEKRGKTAPLKQWAAFVVSGATPGKP